MSILCMFGKHRWDGCKCIKCGKTRDKDHSWDGCYCTKCGATDHTWDGCKCIKCGAVRDQGHDWELVSSIRTKIEDLGDGFFLNGFGQCGPTELVAYCDEYKCKKCGATREEETRKEE